MRKVYALLAISIVATLLSFKEKFDNNYFALTVPFTQDWSNAGLITADDNWSGVPSIEGFRGDAITGATGADPQTLLAADDPGVIDVIANGTNPNTNTSGGVGEFLVGGVNNVVAMQGSGTADAPYLKIYLNTTGVSNIRVQYNVLDIDGSGDDAIQQVALQYRVGTSGSFTNIPAAYIADATTVNTATQITPVDIMLPVACENQTQVQLRIMTTNAAGSDEWVGIDDIVITPNFAPSNTVSLSGGGGTIAENGAPGSFTLTFSAPTAAPTTIDYNLGGSSATLASDYDITLDNGATPSPLTATSGTITVPAAVSSVTLTITPLNDADEEIDETVNLIISNPSGGYSISGSNATATITDDDHLTFISYTGATYTQDFSLLASAGSSAFTPSGWLFTENGAAATYVANNGASNTGGVYSYGTDGDRAFGSLRSGSNVPLIGARVINNTGATISSLAISYRGEQWRLGSTGRNDRLDFQYSLDATDLNSGTWTNVDGLDFIGPLSTGALNEKNGNDPANYIEYSFTINGLSIPSGATFHIRWVDFDAAGADDGLSIDNFSMMPGCTPPTNQPTVLNLTPALTSIDGSFTAAAPGAVNADEYLVIVSTSPTLTGQPVNGTVYAIDDVVGNGEVVSISGTTFTASGLTPATTYYFFVYSNSLPTNCYNITSPLTGNVSTSSPPACTPPATQVSGLNGTNITGTSMDLNYTRGDGDNILIVARTGSAVSANPINGVSYPQGSQIGTGNFVIYNGAANTFNYSGLTQNTTYYFALYEYSVATPCYNTSALTGNFTTSCVTPVNPTGFNPSPQNGAVQLTWTNPTLSCFDEILVVASTAPIPASGSTFVGAGDPAYAGSGEQVVFRGVGTNVTVTGLTNGVVYYFKIFSRNSGVYSSGVQVNAVPFDPSTGFMYLYGNLHSHSSYSDGNADDLTKTPVDDYAFARDANCMDFLGISEHNHSQAGMVIGDYKLGYAQAEAINGVPGPGGNSLLALWGMEWGTIGTGGHMVVYGFGDQLIGWEPGNYDIFCEKGDYTSLLGIINTQPNAFATLAHPDTDDYNDLLGTPYSASKDDAIVGSAIESGPAFSHSTTYNDFPQPLDYLSYWRGLLAKGYRIGATMDQDNHNMTFGTANSNRLVVMTPARSRTELVNALRNMRFYASNDCNVQVDFRINSGVAGSSVVQGGKPTISVTTVDGDGENNASVELWGGEVGEAAPGSPLKTYPLLTNSFTFNSADVENTQPDNTTYYYYLVLTQEDGNKIITSPIWFTRNDVLLPVSWLDFNATYSPQNKATLLKWTTAQEINSREFEVQRSVDGGRSWLKLGTVAAAGSSNSLRHYEFSDLDPQKGTNYYRLRQIDIDGNYDYSKVVSIVIRDKKDIYFSVKPNPAVSGVAKVYASSNNTRAIIQLLDINGRTIRQGQYIAGPTNPANVDLTGTSSGVYFLRITYDGETTIEKIIVR